MLEDLLNLKVPYWCNMMDKNMMAVPIEVRMPFLDYKLLEFVFTLPSNFLLRNGYTKYLLRRVLDQHLPKDIVWKRKKVGFTAPKKSWYQDEVGRFNADFCDNSLNSYINTDFVTKSFNELEPNLAWRLLNFSKWKRLNDL